MRKIITNLIVGALLGSTVCAAEIDSKILDLEKKGCPQGLHTLKGSPFSVYISCEDALGKYITVFFSDKMKAPAKGAWKVDARSWQEKEWSNDVTALAFSPNKNELFVSTSDTYGTGGIYRIKLMEKTSQTISDKQPPDERIFKLKALDFNKKSLTYSIDQDGKVSEHSAKISE